MNLPNKLTLTRIILIPFFIAAIYVPFTGHYFVALAIFALASLTDFFDGKIARKYNLVTDLGNTGMILGGVGVVIILARELTISSLRMMAAKKGIVLAAEYIGKVKTFVTDVTLVVFLLAGAVYPLSASVGDVINIVGLAGFAISVILTIVSGINYLVKNAGVFKE